MYCQNHPKKESVATCVVCGKSICDDCGLNIAGKYYCHGCINEIIVAEAPKRSKTQELSENNTNKALEEKYEKYLDDLYSQEKKDSNRKNNHDQLSLKEQLVREEAEHGSIISKPREPVEPTPHEEILQNNVDKLDLRNKKVNHRNKKNRRSLHPHIQNEQKKKKTPEESSTTEIILTLILIFLTIIVASYILYLFTLAQTYPSFFDAVYTLFSNPAEIINNILS